jgi:Na+/H+-dicarboxylate symporter
MNPKKFSFQSPFMIFLAMGLGLATGYWEIGGLTDVATAASDIFINLLKLISLPIIFLSITATLTGMKSLSEMKIIGKKVFTYTLATTLISATVALILFKLINPVQDTSIIPEGTEAPVPAQASYLKYVVDIVPSNLFQAFIDNQVIGIAFVAIFFSFAILSLPQDKKELLHQFFASLFAALLKMTGFIIKLMPIGIWAFTAILMKDLQQNYAHFNSLMLYLLCVTGANLLQGFVALPILLKAKGIPPLATARGFSAALTLAFFSKSSNATLPVTIRCAQEKLQVTPKIANFSLSLCSVINMNGCAAFILTTTLFVAMSNGLAFSNFEMVAWIFIASIAAIGNAGVPMGCYFLTSAFLLGMDVPLYLMGLILPFYTLLDMLETALNVWSDGCVAVIVNKELAGEKTPADEGSLQDALPSAGV